MVLDHTQDVSGAEIHRLTSLYPPPEFVKQANHARLCGDTETQAAHLYGDPTTRTWPLHSAPATWMSSLFFFNKQAELSPTVVARVAPRIKQAAEFFQIGPQVQSLQDKIANDMKHQLHQLADDEFALVWRTDTGTERHYPLRNPTEIKTAEAWFIRYRDEFGWNDRRTIANKIHEKAAQHAVVLEQPDVIAKTAGYGFAPVTDIVSMLQARASMVKRSHGQLADEMLKLAGLLQQQGLELRDSGTRDKLAGIVDRFDRETKLNQLYDAGGLPRPEDVMFKVTEKAASEFVQQHVQLQSGAIYEKTALAALPLEHVKQWMGDEFADAVSCGDMFVSVEKLADIAPTLPRGDAEMFERMAQAAGIEIFALDKAAEDQGLSPETLQELAAQYQAPAGDYDSVL